MRSVISPATVRIVFDGYITVRGQRDRTWFWSAGRTRMSPLLPPSIITQLERLRYPALSITFQPTQLHSSLLTYQARTLMCMYILLYASVLNTDPSAVRTSYKRGIRTINGRKQVLLQDEINAKQPIMWRMHTNATVSINPNGTSATLKLDGQTMTMHILSAPQGALITTMAAVRLASDPPTPQQSPDQPNPGVTVVTVQLSAGQYNLQILFNPQWSGMSAGDFKTPSFVPIDSWTTTSHP